MSPPPPPPLPGVDPSEADQEWGGRTPLHLACANGHRKCVYVLLRAGAAVNAQTDTGWTPAHYACESGQVSAWESVGDCLFVYELCLEQFL